MGKGLIVAILVGLLLFFVAVVSGDVLNGGDSTSKAFLTPDSILIGWESTYGSIKSMRVSYVERVVETKRLNGNGPTELDAHMHNLSKIHNVERVEAGQLYHMKYSKSENGFGELKDLRESAFDGQYKKEYSGPTRFGTIQRGLTNDTRETMNHLKTYLISEPIKLKGKIGDGEPIFSHLLKQGIERGNVKIEPKMESVSGEMCHVINVGGSFKMWVNHAKGMMVMKYQHYSNGRLQTEICVDKVAKSNTSRGLWYPKRAHRTVRIGNYAIKHELIVKNFEPDIRVTKETFSFEFPFGTEVLDKLTGLNYIKGQGIVSPETEKIMDSQLIGTVSPEMEKIMDPHLISDDGVTNEPQRKTTGNLEPEHVDSVDQVQPLAEEESHKATRKKVVWIVLLILGGGSVCFILNKLRRSKKFSAAKSN
jgi:hypothetical protein